MLLNFDKNCFSSYFILFFIFICPHLLITSGLQDYIHRVGRTARAGRPGVAISLVTDENELRTFLEIENRLGRQHIACFV
jgi:superfamily II DNA/RNA helicase